MRQKTSPAGNGADLRQSVWRWHFMAGLFTLPFLFWLAVTGAVYLFETEIETAIHRPLLVVEQQVRPLAPPALIAAAEASGGTAQAFVSPETARRSAEVVVARPSGELRSVFVDPYSGTVLGDLKSDWRVTDLARRLHGLALLGPVANGVIEAVAGWILILSVTGLYLWWPRPGRGGALTVRGKPASRLFWRDLHAVIGAGVAMFGIFLALTGLMWSGIWGAAVHEGLRRVGQGVPPAMWEAPATSVAAGGHAGHEGHEGHVEELSWTVRGLPGRSEPTAETTSITLAEASTIVEARGLAAGYRLSAPTQPDGVFLASVIPDQASGLRVIQVDRFSGAVANDLSFRDYGAASKAIEWGVSVHMGKEFGRPNQWIMFAACLAIMALGISAIVSWLKRRGSGTIGLPPSGSNGSARVVALIILGVSILFPLTALSAVVIAVIDRMTRRRQERDAPA